LLKTKIGIKNKEEMDTWIFISIQRGVVIWAITKKITLQ
jgi:hypothetical protein